MPKAPQAWSSVSDTRNSHPIFDHCGRLTSTRVGDDEKRQERLAGHWAVEHHWGGQTIAPQCGDEGCRLPVAERGLGTVQQGPPSFRSLAQGGLTGDQLRTFLSHAHGAMPDLSLSRAEIDDLIAYIEMLQ